MSHTCGLKRADLNWSLLFNFLKVTISLVCRVWNEAEHCDVRSGFSRGPARVTPAVFYEVSWDSVNTFFCRYFTISTTNGPVIIWHCVTSAVDTASFVLTNRWNVIVLKSTASSAAVFFFYLNCVQYKYEDTALDVVLCRCSGSEAVIQNRCAARLTYR